MATDRELARQVQYLKEENRILRDKLPKRITVSAGERRRLIKFGSGLGAVINELITIVTPRTFARWLSGESRPSPAPVCSDPRPAGHHFAGESRADHKLRMKSEPW